MRGRAVTTGRLALLLGAAIVAGCDGVAPADRVAGNSQLPANVVTNGVAQPPRAPAQAAFKPWKKDGNCYWLMTYPDGVAHRAWISGGDDSGVFLDIVDSQFAQWPVSDRVALKLRFDGDAARTVAVRGNHGEEDSSTLLQLILERPAGAMLAAANRLEVLRDGQSVIDLPLANNPTAAELEACDPDPGPGEFVEP